MRVWTVTVNQFLCVSWELCKTEQLSIIYIILVYQYFNLQKVSFRKLIFFVLKNNFMYYGLFMNHVLKCSGGGKCNIMRYKNLHCQLVSL